MSDWIVADPEVLGGKPCIRGTRISVEHVLERLATGEGLQDLLSAYPHIPREGLQAALSYAAKALRNEVVWEVKIPA